MHARRDGLHRDTDTEPNTPPANGHSWQVNQPTTIRHFIPSSAPTLTTTKLTQNLARRLSLRRDRRIELESVRVRGVVPESRERGGCSREALLVCMSA